MLFNSYEFLFAFLPLTFLGVLLAARLGGQRWVVAWLALASLLFYVLGEGSNPVLILFSITFNYLMGVLIARASPAGRKRYLLLGVAVNLGLLGWFKYVNFFMDSLHGLTGWGPQMLEVALPVGISFYTFTQIAYLVDASQGLAKDYNPVSYVLFVTFFPHLIAGPILHHKEMMPQFEVDRRGRRFTDLAVGLSIFALGLAKKVLIADTVAPLSTTVFDAAQTGVAPTLLEAWTAALAYTFQIYFDFSAYSDMAIGLARIFGIQLPINFESPYKAVNIADFWRRWHITLSRFLRDYLYIPLGGNRLGEARRMFNLFATMLLGGLWHGAAWTFVLWGALHGLMLAVHRAWTDWRRALSWPEMPDGMARALTFLCVAFTWVPFRAADFSTALSVWKGMLGLNGFVLPAKAVVLSAALDLPRAALSIDFNQSLRLLPLLLIFVLVLPNTQALFREWQPGLVSPGYHPVQNPEGRWRHLSWSPSPWRGALMGTLLALCILHFASISEFIYFRF